MGRRALGRVRKLPTLIEQVESPAELPLAPAQGHLGTSTQISWRRHLSYRISQGQKKVLARMKQWQVKSKSEWLFWGGDIE